ncbi:hypothetical protein V8B97DRAFT_2010537 [Scleroderma yunnanense]
MLDTYPFTGFYTITANSGPVGTDNQHRVVVNRQELLVWIIMRYQVFFLGQVANYTYRIYRGAASVQPTGDYRLIVEEGVTPQSWLIEQYDDEENVFTIRDLNNGLSWTDGGGPPGHQLYLNAFDPNNVPTAQRFTILPANDARGNMNKRR